MTLRWIHEPVPAWDGDKARVLGGAPAGVFDPGLATAGVLPGSWWRVERDGQVVGYGWMDVVWGDGQILVAVDADARGQGVGTWILQQLRDEGARLGLRYVSNRVHPQHPEREELTAWLQQRGFEADDEGRLATHVSRG